MRRIVVLSLLMLLPVDVLALGSKDIIVRPEFSGNYLRDVALDPATVLSDTEFLGSVAQWANSGSLGGALVSRLGRAEKRATFAKVTVSLGADASKETHWNVTIDVDTANGRRFKIIYGQDPKASPKLDVPAILKRIDDTLAPLAAPKP